MPNDSRSERVTQQLQSSQQLLKQIASLHVAAPRASQRLQDNAMDPSRIAQALLERLHEQPLVLRVQ